MALGHCRTPFFLRGKTGVIVGIQGAFHDPEKLAYHKPGLPRQVLYKVRFKQSDLWPNYRGKPTRSPGGRYLRALADENKRRGKE